MNLSDPSATSPLCPPPTGKPRYRYPRPSSALIITSIIANGEFYGLLALGSRQADHFIADDY